MRNYRLTRRGKVVLAIFIFLIIYIPIRLFTPGNEVNTSIDNDPIISKNPVSNEEATDDKPELESEVDISKEDFVESKYTMDEINDLKKIYHYYFEPDSTQLIQDSDISSFKIFDEYIVIEGHINGYPNFNDSPFGIELAENRAHLIKELLIDMGMKDEYIILRNHGSNYPTHKDASESELAKNRRVTVYYRKFRTEE